MPVGLLRVRGELAIGDGSSCHRLVYGGMAMSRKRGERERRFGLQINEAELVFRSNQMIHALSARLKQAAMPRRAMVNHLFDP